MYIQFSKWSIHIALGYLHISIGWRWGEELCLLIVRVLNSWGSAWNFDIFEIKVLKFHISLFVSDF